MPIIGLTDRGASFPRIGTLRKGAPRPEPDPTGKTKPRPGKDLDYFRFDSSDQAAVAAFGAAYGKEPRAVHVFLPFATVADNFVTWQEEYASGGLVHRCDGQTMVLWRDEKGKFRQEARPCPYASGQKVRTVKEPGCRPVGTLKVVIPELKRLAYVAVATTSLHDIMELQANLEAMAAMRGDLRGIPFVLSRRARMISMPAEDGKRVRREKWLLSIEPSPDWVALQLQAMERLALPERGQMLELTARSAMLEDVGERGGLAGMGGLTPVEADWVDEETGEIFDEEEEPGDRETGRPGDGQPSTTGGDGAGYSRVTRNPELGTMKAGPSAVPLAGQNGNGAGMVAEEVDPLVARWLKERKNFQYAPRPQNGQWGALHGVLTGIVGSDANRHRFYSLIFGREIVSANELSNQEAAWLFSFVKPHKAADGAWQAAAQAEGEVVGFMQRQERGGEERGGEEALRQAQDGGFPELAEVLHPQSAHMPTAVEAGL